MIRKISLCDEEKVSIRSIIYLATIHIETVKVHKNKSFVLKGVILFYFSWYTIWDSALKKLLSNFLAAMADSPSLPADIILEILSRTSLQTIGRCALVSKHFKRITYDPSFIKLLHQNQKAEKVSGFFMNINQFSTEFTFMSMAKGNNYQICHSYLPPCEEEAHILATTKSGILLCATNTYASANGRIPTYYVGKPTTKQWEVISNPMETFSEDQIFAMVVLQSIPLRYKILQLSPIYHYGFEYQFKIFDSETWKWKRLKETITISCCPSKPAMSIGSIIYWQVRNGKIFGFNLEIESWEIFALPRQLYGIGYAYDHKMLLVVYESRLGLIRVPRAEPFVELWVMDENDQNIWVRRLRICIETLIEKQPAVRFCSLANFENDVVIFMYESSLKYFIYFKFEDCSFGMVECKMGPKIFPFQSDFEPVRLRSHLEKFQTLNI